MDSSIPLYNLDFLKFEVFLILKVNPPQPLENQGGFEANVRQLSPGPRVTAGRLHGGRTT